MGMLNNMGQLLITRVFWNSCINFFVKFLNNYGWAIILFTIALKIILSPFDILQRRSMKKQQATQARLQPQLEKIKAQCGEDKAKYNQKANELYRQSSKEMTGGCLPMLISMIITMVVFISLFNALNAISKTKDSEIFYQLKDAYTTEQTYVNSTEFEATLTGTEEEQTAIKKERIEDAVLKEYKKQKDKHGFLWVQNLWKSDTTTSPFVKYKTFKNYYEDQGNTIADEEVFENEYKDIIKIVESKNSSQNGFFILIILAGVVSFLVQYISQKGLKSNNKTAGGAGSQTNKIMLFAMPLIMLIFASTSNALFTLYIITNSIMSAIISKIIDLALKGKNDNNSNAKYVSIKSNKVVEYSRNFNKGE